MEDDHAADGESCGTFMMMEEVLRVQRLGKEVGEVVVRVDERHSKTMVLSRFSFSAVEKRTRSATYRCRCPRARLRGITPDVLH